MRPGGARCNNTALQQQSDHRKERLCQQFVVFLVRIVSSSIALTATNPSMFTSAASE